MGSDSFTEYVRTAPMQGDKLTEHTNLATAVCRGEYILVTAVWSHGAQKASNVRSASLSSLCVRTAPMYGDSFTDHTSPAACIAEYIWSDSYTVTRCADSFRCRVFDEPIHVFCISYVWLKLHRHGG